MFVSEHKLTLCVVIIVKLIFMRMKIISALKMVGFVGTVLTSIPLLYFYISNQSPKSFTIVHLHVWLGVMFIIFAATNMIMIKQAKKQNS